MGASPAKVMVPSADEQVVGCVKPLLLMEGVGFIVTVVVAAGEEQLP